MDKGTNEAIKGFLKGYARGFEDGVKWVEDNRKETE